MGYTNSQLVKYTKISPNRNSPRNHSIDRITIHCYVGQASVESMAAWLCKSSAKASCNYGIGVDGRVCMLVEEKDRSWCSSSSANDNRAITIECASDTKHPYAINNTVYKQLINLCADICKRNGKTKLLWFGDKNKTLNYSPKADEMIITVHRWFANKACPGDYIYSRLGKIADEVNLILSGKTIQVSAEPKWYRVRKSWTDRESQLGAYENLDNAKRNCPPGYTVYDYNGNVVYAQLSTVYTKELFPTGFPTSKQDFIDKVSKIAKDLYKETGIMPSVVIAQCCLETGYGLGSDSVELMKVNNILGMKTDLLNSTWQSYSVWKGKSINKVTPEVRNGRQQYITDSFRVYNDYENCIRDYEMFLTYVRNGSQYKYRSILSATTPRDVITIISQNGYATDPSYIIKVLKIIEENNFSKYDEEVGIKYGVSTEPPTSAVPETYYRIQFGSFSSKSNAEKKIKKLQDSNIETVIKEVNGTYKIWYKPRYKSRSNADKKVEEIHLAGFNDAYVIVE